MEFGEDAKSKAFCQDSTDNLNYEKSHEYSSSIYSCYRTSEAIKI